jgi:hypothetical protein
MHEISDTNTPGQGGLPGFRGQPKGTRGERRLRRTWVTPHLMRDVVRLLRKQEAGGGGRFSGGKRATQAERSPLGRLCSCRAENDRPSL